MQFKNAVAGLVVAVGSLGVASTGQAKPQLLCNKQQTKCVTETTQLTIGDRVGIFNPDGELVATGEVEAMRGERRAVVIEKRHGMIRRGYDLTLLEGSKASMETTYKVYREPAKLTLGASAGLSSWTIGEGSPGTELSVYGQWRKWGGLQVVARGIYTSINGDVTRYGETEGRQSAPVTIQGLGLLGGAGYVLRESQPLAFRGEVGLGLMYVNAAIDGDADAVDGSSGYNARIKNGAGAYGRLTLGAIWNVAKTWRVHADFAQSVMHSALGSTLAGGMSYDLQ